MLNNCIRKVTADPNDARTSQSNSKLISVVAFLETGFVFGDINGENI